MNVLERQLDRLGPLISVRLRLAKARMHRDMLCTVLGGFVLPGQTVIDIGANRGVYAWLMAGLTGPTGLVHAFEPHPANVERLEVLARSRPTIVVHPCALSDTSGEAILHVPRYHDQELDALSTLRSTVPVEDESIPVAVHTLDEVYETEIGGPVALIKCDVEGFEDEVIAGGWTMISRLKPVLLIEIEQRHRQRPVGELVDRLLGLGYRGYFIDETGPRPVADFDVARHQLDFLTPDFVPYSMPSGYVSDFLFVPDEA